MFFSRGCKGLQPSKSITAIKALIGTWRGARSLGRRGTRSGNVLLPRLQGTAALQVNNRYQSLDRDLEGARSLGAAEPDGPMFFSRGCKGLQPSKSITAIKVLIVTWKAPRNSIGQCFSRAAARDCSPPSQ